MMSALPPKADIAGLQFDVRFVPKADIRPLFDRLFEGREARWAARLPTALIACPLIASAQNGRTIPPGPAVFDTLRRQAVCEIR
jgi:hypothetical protein